MIKKTSFPLFFLFSIAFFLLCLLGTWQLNKNFNNNKNNNILNDSSLENPKSIFDIDNDLANLTYGKINGQLIDDKIVFLEPRTFNGNVGFHEISVLKVNNKYILVNRGFAYKKTKNQNLKKILKVEGVLMKIKDPKFFEVENDIKNNTWHTLNLNDLQKSFNLKIEPYIIYEQNIKSENRKAVLPNIISDINHLNYAFTWYFLAISLSIIFYFFYRKNY